MKPDDIVLQAPGFACTRQHLGECVTAFARRLQARGTRVLAGDGGGPGGRAGIAADGEIQVTGALMAGYLGDASAVPEGWSTGDVGSMDGHGFLHVEGRCGNALVTDPVDRKVSTEVGEAAWGSASGWR